MGNGGEGMLPILVHDLQPGKKQYRAPFKVHLVEWNPCSDLIALASRKGEVMVKRPGWKKCWKVNVSEVGAFPDFTTSKPGCIESIAWSPDGNVLSVSMNDGHYHLIDVEHGQIRWTRLISINNYAQRLRWCASDNRLGVPRRDSGKKEFIKEEDKAIANILGHKDDVADERLQRTLFLETLYSRSLQNTLLFMVRDDMMVVVVAGGIMPICEINLGHSLTTYGLDIITIYDILYTVPENGVTIACTTYGPRPHCGEKGIFGRPILVEKPSQVPSYAHSHLVNVSMKIENERLIWEIIERYIKMYNNLMHLSFTYDLSHKDWCAESTVR